MIFFFFLRKVWENSEMREHRTNTPCQPTPAQLRVEQGPAAPAQKGIFCQGSLSSSIFTPPPLLQGSAGSPQGSQMFTDILFSLLMAQLV